jgi:hypothetical protein
MDTKFWCLVLLIASSVVLTGCPKECISTAHSFDCKVSYSPNDSLIKIGDTVWINSSFSCQGLYNNATQKQEDYCETKINSTLGIFTLTTDFTPAVDSFDFVNVKGQIFTDGAIRPKEIKQIYFASNKNLYELKIGIIPKKRGRYYVPIGNGLGIRNNSQCEKSNFNISIENKLTHLQMLIDFKGKDITDYERIHGYCFEVR